MHEPVEILSPSRRSSLPTYPTLFRTQFLSSFFFRSLVSPFYFSFCRVSPSFPSPPFTLAARGYWPLSNLIFSHSGDAEKHLRAIKDRRWEVQTMVKKKKREREIEKRSPETRGGTYASDRKTDESEMANVTVERSLRDVKCGDATIDIECRRRDVGTCRDANVSKFCNRTPAAGNDIF